MKAQLVVLVLVAALAVAYGSPVSNRQPRSPVGECPERPGTYPAYLPDSEDCMIFYECSPSGPMAFECPPGTSFNPSMLRCDTANNCVGE